MPERKYSDKYCKRDPKKERLKELKVKPIMTIPELTEIAKLLMEINGIKDE